MANTLQLKNDIKKIKTALASKNLSATFKNKLKVKLQKAESDLKAATSKAAPKGARATLNNLKQQVKKRGYGVYKGAGVDLEKDAKEPALAAGRRVSKGLKGNQYGNKKSSKGNVYYEYRANRLDVKQPSKSAKYPKLEDGGEVDEIAYPIYPANYFDKPNPSNLYAVMELDEETGYGSLADGKVYTINEAFDVREKLNSDLENTFKIEIFTVEDLLRRKSLPKNSKAIILENYRMKKELINSLIERFGENIDWQKDFKKGGKVKEPTVTRGFFDDEAYEYDNGGMMAYGDIQEKINNILSSNKNTELNTFIKPVDFILNQAFAEDVDIDTIQYEVEKEIQFQIERSNYNKELRLIFAKIIVILKNASAGYMADGGMMAKGGNTNLDPYDLRKKANETLIKLAEDIRNVWILEDSMANNSVFENNTSTFFQKTLDICENAKKQFDVIKDKYYKKNYAEGGVTGKEVVDSNAQMVLSKIKEVHHHADELGDIVTTKSDIEAWVVAKIERASTDLSDITHYLDGQHQKMSMGGGVYNHVHKMDKN